MLVHGLGGTGRAIWKNVAADLARDFTVVLFDLRGTGESDRPPGPYSLRDFVEDLEGLIEQLELRAPALVGHSFGGSIVLEYAAVYPERVSAVVAIGGPAALPEQARDALRTRAQTVEDSGMDAVAEPVATNGMAPSFREACPDELQAYVDLLAANDPAAYAATCRVIADLDITGDLPRIRARTLLVAGDQDGVAPPDHNRANAERIPRATFVHVEDCGHILPWEKPDALTVAVLPFLQGAL